MNKTKKLIIELDEKDIEQIISSHVESLMQDEGYTLVLSERAQGEYWPSSVKLTGEATK